MARKYSRADYLALKRSQIPASLAQIKGMRFDSEEDASVFFARELDHVKSKTYDKLYPQFTVLNNIPRTSDANPGAETITFYSYDKTGLAEIISNYATDLPRADVKGKPTTVQIKSLGASYGYNVQEMRASRLAGKGLDARKAEAARFAMDYATNRIALVGDKENGLMGLLSDWNDIPVFILPAGASGKTDFKSKTADEILADFTAFVMFTARVTNDVEKPDSAMIASEVYYDLATRRIPDTDTTILKFLLDNQPYIKKIIPAPELQADNVDVNSYGKNLLVLYTDDPDKMAFEEPMPFYQHPAQNKNLEVEVPCESRVAGLMLYYPLSALIVAGV